MGVRLAVSTHALSSNKSASERTLTSRFISQLDPCFHSMVIADHAPKKTKTTANDDGRAENADPCDHEVLVFPRRWWRNMKNQDFLGF